MSENERNEITNKNNLSITKWAEEDRPREKMQLLGAAQMSNAELLAILIGSGSHNQSAVDLTKSILNDCHNNLNTLGKMTVKELTRYKGMGLAKAITILAACELGKRRTSECLGKNPDLGSSLAIYNFMYPKMQDLQVEEFWIIMMNQNFKLIKAECLSHGGLTETSADIRIIIKESVLYNATVLAVCHNHPSHSPFPSKNDDILTINITKACNIMRIFFMDHIIITDGSYYSYHDQGKL